MIDFDNLRQHAARGVPLGSNQLIELLDHICTLEQEIQEQCRINGMGSEREAALLTKIARLEKDAARYQWLKTKGRSNSWSVEEEQDGLVITHSSSRINDAIDASINGEGND